MNPKHELVRYLLERGLLSHAAVVDGDVTVVERARRHTNFTVLRQQGPGLFIKQMRPDQANSAQTLQKEAAFYGIIAGDPALADVHALMPRMSDPSTITADLKALFRSVKIRGAMEYEINGRIFNLTNPSMQQQPHAGGWSAFTPMLAPLVGDMQLRLYDWAYCRRMSGQVDAPPAMQPVPITDTLSAANMGRERWEQGWRIGQVYPNGSIHAQKGGRWVMFQPGHFMAGHGLPQVGAMANVFLAKESRTLQPGFYYVMSQNVPEQSVEARPTRIYFNIEEAGAPLLVRAISTELNRFEIPFRFKTLSYSGTYVRTDAAVLFFGKRYFPVIARLLPRIRTAVQNHLRPATPLFTRKLADGLGLAEDPGNGESFGSNRVRLVAQAIWDAHVRGLHSEEARLQELDVQFQQHGLRLDQPHLRAGSADLYELPS